MGTFFIATAAARAAAFVGVNIGNHPELMAITDERRLMELVRSAVNALRITGAVVYPARVVYRKDWGCPTGGMVAGAVFAVYNTPISAFERLRKELKLVMLDVACVGEGAPTDGFIADLGVGDLDEIATKWQTVAAEKYRDTGIYVSSGVFAAKGADLCPGGGCPGHRQGYGGMVARRP